MTDEVRKKHDAQLQLCRDAWIPDFVRSSLSISDVDALFAALDTLKAENERLNEALGAEARRAEDREKFLGESLRLRASLAAANKELEQYRKVISWMRGGWDYWFITNFDAKENGIDIAAMKEGIMSDTYDAGLLNDFGGGNVEWWWDYLRAEIGRCNDFHQETIARLTEEVERLKGEVEELREDKECLETLRMLLNRRFPGYRDYKVEDVFAENEALRTALAAAEHLEMELREVLREIVRISDRKHNAWDKAKELLNPAKSK
jgi:DNA repair exonuclease SbcCD ATPase subunit